VSQFSLFFNTLVHFNSLFFNTLVYFNPLNAELNSIYHLLPLLGAHLILHVSRIRVYSLFSNTLVHFNSLFFNTLVYFNPLNAELNGIYHLLALLGAHLILHVSRIRVYSLFSNTVYILI